MPARRLAAMLLTTFAITAIAILVIAVSGPAKPSLATTDTPSPATSYEWGDTDCSGAIDMQDVLRVLSRAAGLQVNPACDAMQARDVASPPLAGVSIVVNPVTVSIPVGETRSVDIVADVASGFIGSWGLTVQYDPAVVTPVSCSGGCNVHFAPGKVEMADLPFNGISGTKVLGSVTFEASGETGRQSAVDLTAALLTDMEGNRVSAALSDGTITIAVSREDLDCRGGVTAQDALDLISYIAGLPATSQVSGCPVLGE